MNDDGPACQACGKQIPRRHESRARHAARRYCNRVCADGPARGRARRSVEVQVADFRGAPCWSAPELFWPLRRHRPDGSTRDETARERREREREAVKVCQRGCMLTVACLDAAEAEEGRLATGVYGGLTSAQVADHLRARRGAGAVA